MAQEQLHDRILRQAYLADPERPALLSTEDMFWRLEEPALTLAQIRECMDWLVRGGDLVQDLRKYALSPVKFFELKAQYAHLVNKGMRVWLAPIAPIHVAIPEVVQSSLKELASTQTTIAQSLQPLL